MTNLFAFDECSILDQCEINIKKAFQIYFSGKSKLSFPNGHILRESILKLRTKKLTTYKFIPSEFERHAIERATSLLDGINPIMVRNLYINIIDQLKEFVKSIKNDYEDISKSDNIKDLKKFFMDNQRKLSKKASMPEDDDIKILAGYIEFNKDGEKYLITTDQGLWGYSDLIEKNYKIKVIESWNCRKIMVNG